MGNLPSPDHVVDFPDDEPINPEPAPIILFHAPAQPEGYVGNDDMEDDEEEDPDEDPEEEPIKQIVPEQNNMDGFALHMNPQPAGNINGWLTEDDDEEVEEDGVDYEDDEEMEMDEEDEDDGVNDNEDEAEVINAYEEVDPLNRPPPASDKETKFAPPVVPVVDADDEPIPPVFALGPKTSDLESVQGRTKKLEKQMFDRYKTERKMAKKFKEDEFRMNRHEYDITALDTAVRENRSDHSKMKKFVLGLSRQFKELKEQNQSPIYTASTPRTDNPYVMVRDAAMAAREDDDDDITPPRDHNPLSHVDLYVTHSRMSAAAISKLVADEVAKALEADRATRTNPNVARGSGGNGSQGAVELCRWFEKTKSVFRIIATLGLNVANGKSWTDMRKMMMEELCPDEEVQRLENELRRLRLRDTNIAAYTQRFNELALLCPEAVPTEKKKINLKELPRTIKGDGKATTTRVATSTTTTAIETTKGITPVTTSIKIGDKEMSGHIASDCRVKAVATGANAQQIMTCYECREKGHMRNRCLKRNDPQGGNATGRAYAIREAKKGQGPNVVVEVHIPIKNEVLVVKGNEGVSRLKVISCIKARKYVEKGSQLFLAHVTGKEPSERRLEDVLVVREFPEVFPDDLPRLPPPRQVEFRIELMPGAVPVALAPYRLAPSEMKELSDQLKELLEKGFIRLSSSP
ncbi:putative reverse transcriptase domain-containing protein [Tanacetum coccineum]